VDYIAEQRSRQGRRNSIRTQQIGKTGFNRETQQYLENSRSGLWLLAGKVLSKAGNRIIATLPAITVFAFKTNKRYDYYNKHLTKAETMN
jgi:hypothetical protein